MEYVCTVTMKGLPAKSEVVALQSSSMPLPVISVAAGFTFISVSSQSPNVQSPRPAT